MTEENQGLKKWIQDNLRIIFSIVIVIAIAGGIYSYSKRTSETQIALNKEPTLEEETEVDQELKELEEELAKLEEEDLEDQVEITDETPAGEIEEPEELAMKEETETELPEVTKTNPEVVEEEVKPIETTPEPQEETPEVAGEEKIEVTPEPQPEPNKEPKPEPKEQVSSTQTEPQSQETEGAFVETAQKGNGLTHLSRQALADYLEKNTDSQLNAEHKIYIEDYLRKHVGHKGGVNVGTSVEFSKELIKESISRAKELNENQLNNLKKYSARVPSLS